MGEYRYAVIELPPSPYAHDLQEVLAFVFDIGVNLAGCTGERVAQAFMASGLAEEFEKQNPVYVAGKSSYDLLRIMVPLLPCDEVPAPCLRYDRTPDFWVGWVLAHYQMVTGCSYRSIFATATYDEIRSMYWPLHEAPESKFVAIFDELRAERAKATNLRTLREAAGLSQSQLAKASGGGRALHPAIRAAAEGHQQGPGHSPLPPVPRLALYHGAAVGTVEGDARWQPLAILHSLRSESPLLLPSLGLEALYEVDELLAFVDV